MMKIILKTLAILLIAIAIMKYFDFRQFVYVEDMDGKSKVELEREKSKIPLKNYVEDINTKLKEKTDPN